MTHSHRQSDESIDSGQSSFHQPGQSVRSGGDGRLRTSEEFDVESVDAAVCAALGCHTDQRLVRITTESGNRRVLCREHAADFLGVKVEL